MPVTRSQAKALESASAGKTEYPSTTNSDSLSEASVSELATPQPARDYFRAMARKATLDIANQGVKVTPNLARQIGGVFGEIYYSWLTSNSNVRPGHDTPGENSNRLEESKDVDKGKGLDK